MPLRQQRQLVGVEGLHFELVRHRHVGATEMAVDAFEGAGKGLLVPIGSQPQPGHPLHHPHERGGISGHLDDHLVGINELRVGLDDLLGDPLLPVCLAGEAPALRVELLAGLEQGLRQLGVVRCCLHVHPLQQLDVVVGLAGADVGAPADFQAALYGAVEGGVFKGPLEIGQRIADLFIRDDALAVKAQAITRRRRLGRPEAAGEGCAGLFKGELLGEQLLPLLIELFAARHQQPSSRLRLFQSSRPASTCAYLRSISAWTR